METRWGLSFTDEEKARLLHIDFVNARRDEVPELPEEEPEPIASQDNSFRVPTPSREIGIIFATTFGAILWLTVSHKVARLI